MRCERSEANACCSFPSIALLSYCSCYTCGFYVMCYVLLSIALSYDVIWYDLKSYIYITMTIMTYIYNVRQFDMISYDLMWCRESSVMMWCFVSFMFSFILWFVCVWGERKPAKSSISCIWQVRCLQHLEHMPGINMHSFHVYVIHICSAFHWRSMQRYFPTWPLQQIVAVFGSPVATVVDFGLQLELCY